MEGNKKQYKRKPQPKFFRKVAVSPSVEVEFSNNVREISKVEFIRVMAPPDMEIMVERTVNGDKQVIVESSPLWRFPEHTIKFKETMSDSELHIGQSQSLIITLNNPNSSLGSVEPTTVYASIHIEKDQIRYVRGDVDE